MFTTSLILEKRKEKKNGTFPILLVVTKKGKRRYVSTGFSCKKKEWDFNKRMFKRGHPNFVKRNAILLNILLKCVRINDFFIEKGEGSLAQFLEKYNPDSNKKEITFSTAWSMLKETNHFKDSEQNTIVSYNSLVSKINEYSKKEELLKNVTVEYLEKFRDFLNKSNKDSTTNNILVRFNSFFKLCIKNNISSVSKNPFDKFQMVKIKRVKTNRALSYDDIKKIQNADFSSVIVQRSDITKKVKGGINENYNSLRKFRRMSEARDFFMFSFFCKGMNFKDIAKLKRSEVSKDRITIIRSKTAHKKEIPISLKILPPVFDIMKKYKEHDFNTPYVFPILEKSDYSKKEELAKIQAFTRRTNKALKEISNFLKLEVGDKISTYYARHSIATILKRKGVDTDKIQQILGHSSAVTTELYLKDFDQSEIDKTIYNALFEEE